MKYSQKALEAKAQKTGDYLFSTVKEGQLVEGVLDLYNKASETTRSNPKSLSDDDFKFVSFMAFVIMSTFAEKYIKTDAGTPDANAIRAFNDHLSARIIDIMQRTGIARVREMQASPTNLELSNLGEPLNLDKVFDEYISTGNMINAGERFALRIAFTIDLKQYLALKTYTLLLVPPILKLTGAVLEGVFASGPN